jgi:lysozyme family protein
MSGSTSNVGFMPSMAFTAREEGGYTNDPNDPGNWTSGQCGEGVLIGTYGGISAPELIAWLAPHEVHLATASFMKNLPEAERLAIFGAKYWNPIRGNQLLPGVDLLVFDHAVNVGVRGSIKLLQQAHGSPAATLTDGWVTIPKMPPTPPIPCR